MHIYSTYAITIIRCFFSFYVFISFVCAVIFWTVYLSHTYSCIVVLHSTGNAVCTVIHRYDSCEYAKYRNALCQILRCFVHRYTRPNVYIYNLRMSHCTYPVTYTCFFNTNGVPFKAGGIFARNGEEGSRLHVAFPASSIFYAKLSPLDYLNLVGNRCHS